MELKNSERPRISNAIAEARAHGDLKENAEYHAAREEQGLIEAQIKDLEHKLSLAQVIDVTTLPQNGKVVFGTTVILEDIDNDTEVTYKIVGQDESNINNGLLAYNTPIEIETPGGNKTYEIVEILYQ